MEENFGRTTSKAPDFAKIRDIMKDPEDRPKSGVWVALQPSKEELTAAFQRMFGDAPTLSSIRAREEEEYRKRVYEAGLEILRAKKLNAPLEVGKGGPRVRGSASLEENQAKSRQSKMLRELSLARAHVHSEDDLSMSLLNNDRLKLLAESLKEQKLRRDNRRIDRESPIRNDKMGASSSKRDIMHQVQLKEPIKKGNLSKPLIEAVEPSSRMTNKSRKDTKPLQVDEAATRMEGKTQKGKKIKRESNDWEKIDETKIGRQKQFLIARLKQEDW